MTTSPGQSDELFLMGSIEVLTSPRVLPFLVAAVQAGIPLPRKETSTVTVPFTPMNLPPPPATVLTAPNNTSTASVTLCYGTSIRLHTTRAALRFLAEVASLPTAQLLGSSPVEQAQVDAWLSYSWASVELPLTVALREAAHANAPMESQPMWDQALETLDRHLLWHTFLVGAGLTVADWAVAALLYTAAQQGLWDPTLADPLPEEAAGPSWIHLKRWYQTVIHQEAWIQALKILPSLSAGTVASTTPAAATGVMLNGPPTAVVNKMYRRRRIRIKELLQDQGTHYVGQTVTVAGWARTIRKASSKLLFVLLNDGSTGDSLQCVLDANASCEGFDDCKSNGGTGSSFQFVGTLVPSQGSEQPVDLQVSQATLLGAVYGGNAEGTEVGGMLYPMSKKEHTLEHMRDHAHLRPRGQIHAAAMRIRHAMAYATHHFFHSHGFLYIHTPILTGADCEGAGEQFAVTSLLGNDHLQPDIQLPYHRPPEPEVPSATEEGAPTISKSEQKRLAKKKAKATVDPTKPEEQVVVGAVDYTKDFFCQRVNLTVSGQLNVETHACALSDVYTFGPTFRAEESRTYRHLSEFWMIEPEIAFADLTDDINLMEDYLKYCVQFALEHCADDLAFFEQNEHGEAGLRTRLRNVLEHQFKRLTYTEAIEILQKAVADGAQFEVKPEWGIDLPSEHERFICEKIFGQPVVLTDYPKEIKAFYMKLNEDGNTVAAADVLVPKIGEIIGGSQREHRLDVLRERCAEMHLDPRNVWWYLDLRRYGTVPHAGFGLGFERLILFITGLDNIRDVIPFPRWVGNAKF